MELLLLVIFIILKLTIEAIFFWLPIVGILFITFAIVRLIVYWSTKDDNLL